ncbi:MAG TPA: response regulator transcription factor [Arcobacter sp.]|jgi:DNA-binding response OmpR family regulator|nr:response regulator transcription factor [Arcobacter sp.]
MKALLLEDDYALNKLISNALESKGFMIHSYYNGIDAAKQILHTPYDIYILDINVPSFDGHDVLSHIRQERGDLPVIMISAASDIESIQKSYSLGCNDYLKKPFELEELFLRIEYLLKSVLKQEIFEKIDLGFGLSFCQHENKLFKYEHEINLTKKESLLLNLLIQNLNQSVPIEMIHEYVWESKEIEAVSMRSVIHKLQKKLKAGMIVNIRGVGYKLIK